MRGRVLMVVVIAALTAVLATALQTSAQGVSNDLLTDYLRRLGVEWKRSDRDPNTFSIFKTSGLKRATKIEIVLFNDPKNDEVDLLAYPQVSGRYLAEAAVRDKAGLMRAMLRNNVDAFGAYFLDKDGDFGFKYVFTTESGLGYEAFKTVVTELFRIADDPMVKLYDGFR